jgi:hypothetical protein
LKRRFWILLLIIGFIGSLSGAYIHTCFFDVERSRGNTFQAGVWPVINATKSFNVPKPNKNGEYVLKLTVLNYTGTIIAAAPQIFISEINVTNISNSNISRIEILDILPKDWTWIDVTLLFHYTNGKRTPITPPQYEVNYNSKLGILNVTLADITSAIGKPMEKGETISLTFLMQFNLTGQKLPEEYRTRPPTYTNTAKATAWSTDGIRSKEATATAKIKTEIEFVG